MTVISVINGDNISNNCIERTHEAVADKGLFLTCLFALETLCSTLPVSLTSVVCG